MKGKDRVFMSVLVFAFLLSFIPVISTFKMVNESGVGMEGNPIHRVTFSFSPWLVFTIPLIFPLVIYGMYRWNGNGGLVSAGMWFGIELSDSILHLLMRFG